MVVRARVLAEMYVGSVATLTPTGDLVVTLGDVVDQGLKWSHLWSILPYIGHLPIVAIVVTVGKRRIRIPKRVAREFDRLTSKERSALLAKASRAKTDDEAERIIKDAVALGPDHHLATSRNWVSALRGGPWTPRFEKIFKRAGMTLEDAENIVSIPGHFGPHPEECHKEIFNRLQSATEGKAGANYKQSLVAELRSIAVEARTAGSKLNRLLRKSVQ